MLSCSVEHIQTQKRKGGGGGTEIVFVRVPYNPPGHHSKGRTLTVLYSHANAVDLGQMLPFFKYVPM